MSLISGSNTELKTANLKKYIFLLTFIIAVFAASYSYANVQPTFSGSYELRYINFKHADVLNPNINGDIGYFDLRFTLISDFMINENTSGVVGLESGHTVFGIDADNTSDEAVPGTDSIDLKLKSAYVDFVLPNGVSNFKVGLQPVTIFDKLIANEDAWGITYLVEADRTIQINFVKIAENSVSDDYKNPDNPERASRFASIFYENDIFTTDLYSLLLGLYSDNDANIDGILYENRRATYYGLGYKWSKHGIDCELHILYDSGKKRYTDALNNSVSKKSEGYFASLTLDRSFENFDLDFEFVLATGDDNPDDDTDRAFMSVDGLVNFYDRAYILSGYITKDDADEKDGIFDSSVYKLSNLVFVRLGSEIRFSDDIWLDLAAMYAINDKSVISAAGKKASDIGGEVDATLTFDVFDTYRDTKKGLLLNFFSAYFVPGNTYDRVDGSPAEDIYILGTGLEYTF